MTVTSEDEAAARTLHPTTNCGRFVGFSGQSLPILMASRMRDVLWGELDMTHQGGSSKSGDSFYRPFRTA
jgi:hypothetical protein